MTGWHFNVLSQNLLFWLVFWSGRWQGMATWCRMLMSLFRFNFHPHKGGLGDSTLRLGDQSRQDLFWWWDLVGILQWTRNFWGSLRIHWGKLAPCLTTDVLSIPWSYLILMSLVSGMYPSNFKVWIRRMVRRFKWRCKNWVVFVQAFGRECYLGFGACDGPRNVRLFCWSFGKLTWKWTLKMMVFPCHCMFVSWIVNHVFCFCRLPCRL